MIKYIFQNLLKENNWFVGMNTILIILDTILSNYRYYLNQLANVVSKFS